MSSQQAELQARPNLVGDPWGESTDGAAFLKVAEPEGLSPNAGRKVCPIRVTNKPRLMPSLGPSTAIPTTV